MPAPPAVHRTRPARPRTLATGQPAAATRSRPHDQLVAELYAERFASPPARGRHAGDGSKQGRS